ncbi:hypothetical protein [Bizionia arctica]|uniref:Uncharacterized protein n=1 Tax=Bizionia arctica TaxID=1495645 RepID=A0A917GLS6_9FLAO|nr:hypothetical protein [Bizionia arctica]GGG51461.1 hypothetical protein GCM10010976_23300 [Bizionia arctica]
MKKLQVLFIFGFLLAIGSVQSQNLQSEQQIRRQEAKVDTVYTVQERANMEYWFNERVNEMALNDELREQYDTIVFSYIYQMSRLNDADKDYCVEEIHERFDVIVDNMNAELKQLLTNEQYINHLENFNEIVRSIDHKYGWGH